MAEWREYCVPEYYDGFQCKAGNCRCSCCKGWGISMSMRDYFRLVGMACPEGLRRKLDVALYRLKDATEDRYAQILPDWRGDCPMHLPNGYCQLQCECGEAALPSICRYYPRASRTAFEYACACSNSCEAVLEALFRREEPLKFYRRKLAFDTPEESFEGPAWVTVRYPEVRDLCIETVQDRKTRLPDRLNLLGRRMLLLHRACLAGEDAVVQALAEARKLCAGRTPPEPSPRALCLQLRLSALFEDSLSVGEYVRTAVERLNPEGGETLSESIPGGVVSRCRAAAAHLVAVLPAWENMFEHMLVNHMAYESFPFAHRYESLWDAYVSLCAVYGFVRFLAMGWMADKTEIAPFVDVCAAAFRLIEHSDFDFRAATLARSMGLDQTEDAGWLAQI